MAYGSFEDWEEKFLGKRSPQQGEELTPGFVPPSPQYTGVPLGIPLMNREEAMREIEMIELRREALDSFPQWLADQEAADAAKKLGISFVPKAPQTPLPSPYDFKDGMPSPEQMNGGIDGCNQHNESMPWQAGQVQPYGLPLSNTGENASGIFQKPFHAMASAGAAADVGYTDENGYDSPSNREYVPYGNVFVVTDEFGNPQYQLMSGKEDYDQEFYDSYPDVTPRPKPTPSPTLDPTPTSAPTLTPPPPKYSISLAKYGGYADNKSIYPGVTEWTLMPLEYLMQAQAIMVNEEYPYAADQMISGKENDKRSECVGMIRLPGTSWYLGTKDKHPLMHTKVDGTYRYSTHKGDFTASTEKFNGMQLITKDFTHIVTYYEEFFDGEVMHYDVIVHDAGKKYKEITDDMTPEQVAAAREYNRGVDKYNKDNKKKAEIVPFDEVIAKNGKYHYEFKYWCAPDYIDYGDQTDPDTGELLTPKKQWK